MPHIKAPPSLSSYKLHREIPRDQRKYQWLTLDLDPDHQKPPETKSTMATNTPTNNRGHVSPYSLSPSPPPPSPPRLKLPLLDLPCPETDTLIYLHPTAPSPPLRCSSQKLLATGSPVLTKLLGPTCQYRLLRRKNLLKLGLPMGVKFVVDLSPPTEGEEAVDVVERLWCPDEVLRWNSKLPGNYFEEDEAPPPSPKFNMPSTSQSSPEPQSPHDEEWEGGQTKARAEAEAKKKARELKPAYSPIRHTGAIERVLHILHGLDPQVHTTPMWYTVHKVALQLECTTAVQDHTLSWLYGNLDFIERHPALVLKIAAEMKNVDLFRDAFAILVGGQLLGGMVGNAGSFMIDESVPPDAEPWGKGIVAARNSLQTRLERLYSYIDSTAWLDNVQVIPEYKKITAHLTAETAPHVRELAKKLDAAIRADIKTQLISLRAFSEEFSQPNWMDPWEKAVFDMMPRQSQIFSRMYWKQLLNIQQDTRVFGENTTEALLGWEMGLKAQEEGKWGMGVPQSVEVKNEKIVCVYQEKMNVLPERLEPLKTNSRGKGKERSPISPIQTPSTPLDPEHRFRNPSTTQHWKSIKDTLKLTRRLSSSSQSSVSAANHADSILPPISPARTTSRPTQLPGICEISHSTTAPPTYKDGSSLVDKPPAYTVIASLGTAVEAEVEKVGEKRKSRGFSDHNTEFEYGYESDTDVEEIEGRCKVGDRHCDKTMMGYPKAERIEISNPMRKRRCSVEREGGDDDENITEASFCTQHEDDAGGEPEMFKISGVYEDTEPGPGPTKPMDKGKGKAVEASLEPEGENVLTAEKLTAEYANEIGDLHCTGPVGSAFDKAMALAEAQSTKPTLSPAIAYWRSSNTKIFAAENATFGPPSSWLDPEGSGTTVARLVNHDWSSYAVKPLRPLKLCLKLAVPEQYVEKSCPQALAIKPSYLSEYESFLFPTSQRIDMWQLWRECLGYLRVVGTEQLKVPISFEPVTAGDGSLLVCLRNEEWRFCPLWAGGMVDYNEANFGIPDPAVVGGRTVELEVRGGLMEAQKGEVEGEGSIAGSYDDCGTEVGSVGSFSTGGFSSFGVLSDFDSESEAATIAGESEVEMESAPSSDVGSEVDESTTEAGDSSDDAVSEGFEEVAWDDDDF